MKERYQSPTLNEDIKLRLYSFNANARANLTSIDRVEIWYLDPELISDSNPDGRRLVETIVSNEISSDETGLYSFTFNSTAPTYVIGNYIDIWYVNLNDDSIQIENNFKIERDLWFTTTTPLIYDFKFGFRPNKFRVGSKRWMMIEISPNVPNQSDLYDYYSNLAIVSPIKIFMSLKCGACVPSDEESKLVIDGDDVEIREMCLAYYQLDTSELACGIYDVWFEMNFGDNIYISDKYNLQIY
jgi:hypothetical protein